MHTLWHTLVKISPKYEPAQSKDQEQIEQQDKILPITMPKRRLIFLFRIILRNKQKHNEHKSNMKQINCQQRKPKQDQQHKNKRTPQPYGSQNPCDIDGPFKIFINNQNQT
jgi:hypothetical protein